MGSNGINFWSLPFFLIFSQECSHAPYFIIIISSNKTSCPTLNFLLLFLEN